MGVVQFVKILTTPVKESLAPICPHRTQRDTCRKKRQCSGSPVKQRRLVDECWMKCTSPLILPTSARGQDFMKRTGFAEHPQTIRDPKSISEVLSSGPRGALALFSESEGDVGASKMIAVRCAKLGQTTPPSRHREENRGKMPSWRESIEFRFGLMYCRAFGRVLRRSMKTTVVSRGLAVGRACRMPQAEP